MSSGCGPQWFERFRLTRPMPATFSDIEPELPIISWPVV